MSDALSTPPRAQSENYPEEKRQSLGGRVSTLCSYATTTLFLRYNKLFGVKHLAEETGTPIYGICAASHPAQPAWHSRHIHDVSTGEQEEVVVLPPALADLGRGHPDAEHGQARVPLHVRLAQESSPNTSSQRWYRLRRMKRQTNESHVTLSSQAPKSVTGCRRFWTTRGGRRRPRRPFFRCFLTKTSMSYQKP